MWQAGVGFGTSGDLHRQTEARGGGHGRTCLLWEWAIHSITMSSAPKLNRRHNSAAAMGITRTGRGSGGPGGKVSSRRSPQTRPPPSRLTMQMLRQGVLEAEVSGRQAGRLKEHSFEPSPAITSPRAFLAAQTVFPMRVGCGGIRCEDW